MTRLLQKLTLYAVNNDFSVTIRHVIWCQWVIVCYKKARYVGTKKIFQLEEGLYMGQ